MTNKYDLQLQYDKFRNYEKYTKFYFKAYFLSEIISMYFIKDNPYMSFLLSYDYMFKKYELNIIYTNNGISKIIENSIDIIKLLNKFNIDILDYTVILDNEVFFDLDTLNKILIEVSDDIITSVLLKIQIFEKLIKYITDDYNENSIFFNGNIIILNNKYYQKRLTEVSLFLKMLGIYKISELNKTKFERTIYSCYFLDIDNLENINSYLKLLK